MSDPKFKGGDKAEFRTGGGWTPIHIESNALRWAACVESTGCVYLAQHSDLNRGQMPFLVHEDFLRKPEQWEPCPGTHRVKGSMRTTGQEYGNMERRVD